MLLSDVCLSVAYIGPNLRTKRPRKTEIGTEVAHVTRDSDTSFKVKGQLVADILNSQHAGIGETWRINTKILLTCRGRRHIVAAGRLQLVEMETSLLVLELVVTRLQIILTLMQFVLQRPVETPTESVGVDTISV